MNVKRAIGVVLAVAGLTGGAVPLVAHHAFNAEFDANKPVSFSGVVTKVEWINPHVWIHMDVQMPNGKTENWGFEAGTPSVLFRRGFSKASLTPGTKIRWDPLESTCRHASLSIL